MDVQYITNEAGSRVGVLLDLDTYRQLTVNSPDPELLVNVSREELTALADTTLSNEVQTQLGDLLARNNRGQLSEIEMQDLDRLLSRIDHLNILKTRARYTLHHLASCVS